MHDEFNRITVTLSASSIVVIILFLLFNNNNNFTNLGNPVMAFQYPQQQQHQLPPQQVQGSNNNNFKENYRCRTDFFSQAVCENNSSSYYHP